MVTAERVCAWCGMSMGNVEGDFDPDHRVTHGICAACGCALLRAGGEIPAQEFLDRLGVPVLLVDREGRPLAAGRRAREVLGKEFPPLEEFLGGGAVIECFDSATGEGCGGEVLCRSRAIVRAVAETYETGRACVEVPAFPDAHGGTDRAATLRITTEKVGDLVVLRVDE